MEKITAFRAFHNSDYDRLRTLYNISKKLSTFKNVDESFAAIVACAAESFPLSSAVLIEHWESKPRTAVWFSAEASKSTVVKALLNAKTSYSYFAGASILEASEFLQEFSDETELTPSDKTCALDNSNSNQYITLPLMIDNLPPLGALQLEGGNPLEEKDLEFVNALANLVSVALDRFYKTKKERAFNQAESKSSLEAISVSNDKVDELEVERALREDFVSLITHDLKSPLAVIVGAGELICRRKDVSEPCLKLGEMIVNQSRKVVRMINNLLDANHLRSGKKLDLKLEKTNLNSLVVDTVSELRMVHGDRFVIVSEHPIEISCDVNGISRLLENLCNNAIKYGYRDTSVKIILEESKSSICIKVNNRGPIISAEDQKTIFEQYHRTSDAIHGHREGWGIGLALVRGVAESHGGTVEVESTIDLGTTFKVNFPKNISLLN
jgi:signal transduction histidine kinase